jgi:hypothetical protein
MCCSTLFSEPLWNAYNVSLDRQLASLSQGRSRAIVTVVTNFAFAAPLRYRINSGKSVIGRFIQRRPARNRLRTEQRLCSLVDDKPGQAPLYDFNEFSSLIGFRGVWDFEKKYASLEAD